MVKQINDKLAAEGYEPHEYPWGTRWYKYEEDIDWGSNVDVYQTGEVKEWHILGGPGALPVTDFKYNSIEHWLNGVIAE